LLPEGFSRSVRSTLLYRLPVQADLIHANVPTKFSGQHIRILQSHDPCPPSYIQQKSGWLHTLRAGSFMSFLSLEFVFAALVFFPIYWRIFVYKQLQLSLLILSAYLLYASWSPVSAIAIFFYTLYIWLAGRWINASGPTTKVE
jgi:hypothetical protein